MDDVIVAQHQDTQATTMSINSTGDIAVLGSKRHLALIDLDNPTEIVKRINLSNKYDLSRVLWNPNAVKKDVFLTTYNQRADIWQLTDGTGKKV